MPLPPACRVGAGCGDLIRPCSAATRVDWRGIDALFGDSKVAEHVLRIAGQEDARRVARHRHNGHEPDVEYSLLPRLQHVEGRVQIVHEVVPLDLLVQAI